MKITINTETTFIKSLIIGIGSVFLSNLYYILVNSPSANWGFDMLVTSVFITIYAIIFILISKKLLKNNKSHSIVIVFNLLLSFVFLGFANSIQTAFQDYPLLYVAHRVPMHPYIIILGLGIITYTLAVVVYNILKKSKDTSDLSE
jgi:hypothetical protein